MSRIVDERKITTCRFESLREGDTFFEPNENLYCMKIEEVINATDEDERYNAVNLDNGALYYFGRDEDVVTVTVWIKVVK